MDEVKDFIESIRVMLKAKTQKERELNPLQEYKAMIKELTKSKRLSTLLTETKSSN